MTTETDAGIWLDTEQQHSWRAYLVGTTLLMDRLDRDLREQHDLSMPEYEIMVRLSESPDRTMRMAALADSLSHSRSRVTHTVSRMERSGLVDRRACVSDGRGVEAQLTEKGFSVLEEAAHTHVRGVRDYLVELSSEDDFRAVGRVFDAVSDRLLAGNEGLDIR
ncbi:MarR family winged helix-turn-helix transcriptional regulator [Nocardioides mesophilus]|uniref:MarR family transcriptional regulator n=1 Tax=Nocardioides mesophilus TaxID=433659 RepID=A0A7G9RCU5_9ACTN|nr:MarR family transcriptional regulator [Nocardioides mesophilus]QNN53420.1 MarR family transcriptional regulator [Nocardioides mesophilus]